MQAAKSLELFIDSKSPEAIVLQGAWGIGKTHLWRSVLTSRRERIGKDEKSLYVSLFGINSLEALKLAVAYAADLGYEGNARKTPNSANPSRLKACFNWIKTRAKDLCHVSGWKELPKRTLRALGWRGVPDAIKVVPTSMGGGAGLAQALGALAFYHVRDELICFDDIERHGKDLSLKDFLGLVSFLVEQRRCRVCVILNEAQLEPGDKATWDSQREKAFSAEITYNPSVADRVAVALKDTSDERWRGYASAALEELEIRNVRLIRRMTRLLRLVFISEVPQSLTQEIVRKTIFLEYSHSGSAEGAPPLEFLKKFSSITRLVAQIANRDKEVEDENERRWADLAENYGFNGDDEISRVLMDAVQVGFPDLDRVASAVRDVEVEFSREAERQGFRHAWNLYHHYVTENGEEVLDAIERTWPAVSSYDNVSNLLSVVGMLRRNGRGERASHFIDQWLLERSGDRAGELEPRELCLFTRIEDEEFLRKAEDARVVNQKTMPLADALQCLAEGKSMEDAVAAVAASSASSLVEALELNSGAYLPSAIQECLKLAGYRNTAVWEAAQARMREALLIIAGRSQWSADRVWWKYQVKLPSDS
ncbi:hypothetical protein OII53_22135 [Achromobacter ruhlandii]|uniref:hypothetical protein n=1 Tax=Achromobacter ruhlandii TaxID=72557 RepID=UPI0021F24A25|nr:hypothetical protein [Achromobacter ruhlandii]MCV6798516.1 hypothetical protein [Achromobacter ruhlandii]MCV6802155.1 hypothetical protein [Achromobacter ruhlandii]MCV6810868.1 hypothetical protein [Achromobacter ruhlandii]MCV6821256.1 hypothetical protein [Achromobacter ruhlandii]